jgi:hypothetical protein
MNHNQSRAGKLDNANTSDSKESSVHKQVRAALQMAILQIMIPQDRIHRTRTTPGAIRALTELVFQYTVNSLGPDLYFFSNHANRKSTIAPEDVALILRKIPHLQEKLQAEFGSATTASTKEAPQAKSKSNNQKKRRLPSTHNQHLQLRYAKSNDYSFSSSDGDDNSLQIGTKRKPSTNPAKAPSPKTKVKLKARKELPSFAERERELEDLLESSSDDDNCFRKITAQQKKDPAPKRNQHHSQALGIMNNLSPDSPPKRQQQQSQVLRIMKNLSPDSGISGDEEDNENYNLDGDDSAEQQAVLVTTRLMKRNKHVLMDSSQSSEEGIF